MKITILLIILFLSGDILSLPNDSGCVRAKKISQVIYESKGIVKIDEDSCLFNGYLVFEVHQKSSKLFDIGDSTISKVEIFYIKDLENINARKERIFYSTTSYAYAYADEIPYDTGKGNNKGVEIVLDNKEENFQKLKSFYDRYIQWTETLGAKFFLSGSKTSAIFDTTSVPLVKYNKNDVSYFIFSVKFFGAIFDYKSEVYLFSRTLGDRYISFDNQKFFLPVSKSFIFEPVDENVLFQNGFKIQIGFQITCIINASRL
ncbi:MAG: hypothetical protein K1X86_11900 [Ignavibacteria bacterium]|nr:hypothetical protein [Ignavibacteria bacterium]